MVVVARGIGPKCQDALRFLVGEDVAPVAFPGAPQLPSDFGWGLVSFEVCDRLHRAGYLWKPSMGQPLKLTKKGRDLALRLPRAS